jgi:dTDP-4-dehydrorhamnose 3,5-epimerase
VHFTETDLPGVFVIDPEPIRDERGGFARIFCTEEFEEHRLEPRVVQSNLSINHRAGTLRGLHYQHPPAAETKLVRCVRGAIFDVAVDLRPDSPTYLRWVGAELTADNHRAFFVPRGCAHGFQTLEDDTLVLYDVSAPYAPDHEDGAHHADPVFGIDWPLPVSAISDKDRSWPFLTMGKATS